MILVHWPCPVAASPAVLADLLTGYVQGGYVHDLLTGYVQDLFTGYIQDLLTGYIQDLLTGFVHGGASNFWS